MHTGCSSFDNDSLQNLNAISGLLLIASMFGQTVSTDVTITSPADSVPTTFLATLPADLSRHRVAF